MKLFKSKEVDFGEYDEPVLTENQEKEIYGEIPEVVPEIPQSHGVEENYETGDTNIQEG